MSLLRGRTAWQLALVSLAGLVMIEATVTIGMPSGGVGPLSPSAVGIAAGLVLLISVAVVGILAARAADARGEQRIAGSLAEVSRRGTELRATLENMLQGVAMYDAKYRLVTWNEKFREYLDMPDHFFDGKHTFADYIRYLAQRGEFGEVTNIEGLVAQRLEPLSRKHSFERVRPDGTILEVYRNPIPAGGFIAIYTDVTARKEAESRLREDEERFRAIDGAAPIAIVIVRARDQYVQHVNPYFCGLFEVSAASVLDRPAADIFADSTQGEALAALLARGKSNGVTQELRFVRADGGEIWVMASVELLRFHGEFAMIACLSNITDRKRTEVELIKAMEAAEAANRVKSDFLANMSHELRTPLNAIIGYSQMLQEQATDDGQDDYLTDLAKIERAGTHLLQLINDILDLSKIEAGRMTVFIETVNVTALLAEVQSIIEPLAAKNDNRLVIDCAPDIGNIDSDVTKLKQSLLNLLSNASKFTTGGTVELAVSRTGADADGQIAFRVTDTGIGMNQEQMDRLFQAFAQADSSTTRKFGGTGLGLAITRHFVRMLGGDVTVSSEPGVGSVFTLVVPMRDRSAPSVAPASGEPRRMISGAAAGALTVLVVDDDEAVHDVIGTMLAREGYRILHARSGQEALTLAREQHPDAITLDVMMPQMDGWSVLSALKADPALRDIPVTIVTMLHDKAIALSLGAEAFLSKPVDWAQLSAVLKRHSRHETLTAAPMLVVDDDPQMREMARRMLERMGVVVHEVADGAQAITWLETNPRPSAILLDLMMPVMDGFEVLERLRQNADWADIPVVVATAKEFSGDELEQLQRSTERVISKGATMGLDLRAAIRETLTRIQPEAGN